MKNLFIVGAQRSGSTYLYKLLDEHPQVSMIHPVRPEPKFFLKDLLVANGRDYYESHYFHDRKEGGLYFGEKSTSYIESIDAARRIHGLYPGGRVLMVLRDPVMRAYSNFRFSVANQLEASTFTEALELEPKRLKSAEFSTSVTPFAYRQRGHYIDYIEAYLGVFDKSQLCILIFEELVSDLANVQALYRWLGVDDGFVPGSLHQIVNPGVVERDEQEASFRSLVLGYQDSLARLESYLGRRIELWRENHRKICSGAAI